MRIIDRYAGVGGIGVDDVVVYDDFIMIVFFFNLYFWSIFRALSPQRPHQELVYDDDGDNDIYSDGYDDSDGDVDGGGDGVDHPKFVAGFVPVDGDCIISSHHPTSGPQPTILRSSLIALSWHSHFDTSKLSKSSL